jgi:hypothetical protein
LLSGFRSRLRSLTHLDALSLVLLSLTLVCWATGILRRRFDYDELEHAYVISQMTLGARPFYDFFECHPPFLWYPLSVLFRIVGTNYALLFISRALSGVGQLLLLVAIARNVSLSFRRLSFPWRLSFWSFVAAAALIASHLEIMHYLLEFRIDAWPNAILLMAIYRYRRGAKNAFRSAVVFGALAALAIACSPKLVVFLGLFVVFSLVLTDRRPQRLAGMAAGGAGGLVLAVLVLLALRLDPRDVYHLSITYHRLLNQHGGFGHGLAIAVKSVFPVSLGIIVAGVVAWLVVRRLRVLSAPFELAVLGFLALQLVLVSFGYKQYYGPWFLLGTVFIPYLDPFLSRWRPVHAVAVAIGFAYAIVNGMESYRYFAGLHEAEAEIAAKKAIEAMAPPKGYVLASIEFAPLFRRGPYYHLATSFAPSGFDTASIMQLMKRSPFSEHFTKASYARELEAARPHVIVLNGVYAGLQRAALDEYAAKHRDDYRPMDTASGPVLVRKP